jgi:hypothetical protein
MVHLVRPKLGRVATFLLKQTIAGSVLIIIGMIAGCRALCYYWQYYGLVVPGDAPPQWYTPFVRVGFMFVAALIAVFGFLLLLSVAIRLFLRGEIRL